jgi:hypothetical protein
VRIAGSDGAILLVEPIGPAIDSPVAKAPPER